MFHCPKLPWWPTVYPRILWNRDSLQTFSWDFSSDLYPSSQFYSFFTSTDISVTEFEKMFTLYKEGYWQRRERVPCCSACTLEVRVIRGEHLLSAYSSFYRIFFDILCLNQSYLDIKAFTYLGLYLTMKWAIFWNGKCKDKKQEKKCL